MLKNIFFLAKKLLKKYVFLLFLIVHNFSFFLCFTQKNCTLLALPSGHGERVCSHGERVCSHGERVNRESTYLTRHYTDGPSLAMYSFSTAKYSQWLPGMAKLFLFNLEKNGEATILIQ